MQNASFQSSIRTIIPALFSTKNSSFSSSTITQWISLQNVPLPSKWINSALFYFAWFCFFSPSSLCFILWHTNFSRIHFPLPPPKANQNWPRSWCWSIAQSTLAIRNTCCKNSSTIWLVVISSHWCSWKSARQLESSPQQSSNPGSTKW